MYLLRMLDELPWALSSLILIILFTLYAIVGLLIVRKITAFDRLRKHQEVAGYVFANVGVLYAVLLGYTVVNVQDRFNMVQKTAEEEAGHLANLYRDAEVFGKEARDKIRKSIVDYATSVIDEEWDLMAQGLSSPSTVHALNSLWSTYYDLTPTTDKEKIWYEQSIERLGNFNNSRLNRLSGSRDSLSPMMWAMLIAGGFTMVGYMWFFGVENLFVQILMSGVLAAITAFLLFLIYSLDTAFSGDVKVESHAMSEFIRSMPERQSENFL